MIATPRIWRGLSLLAALVVPGTGAAAAETDLALGKAAIFGAADFGGWKKRVDGSQEKFEEYRDLRDGFLLNELGLDVQGGEKPTFLDLKARNAARGDESYRVEGGRHGKFKIGASFDRIPHNFNKGTLILSGAGTASLGIPNQIQTSLQAVEQTRGERGTNPLTDTTGEDALQQAVIRNILSAADPTVFKLDREKGSLTMDWNLTREARTWVRVSDERRGGLRQIGAGTYERYPQGAAGLAHTADLFFVSGMELAEPIDYRTTSVNAGAGIYTKAWSADLAYTFTEFRDRLESLVWANPFRTTDATATSAADAPTSNAFNRGRFIRGRMSLPPSSQSHDVTASGSVELPLRSRLTASLGLGLVRQNELLLPYTLNSAMAGVGGAPAGITDPSILPASRFNGEVRTLAGSFQLSSKPAQRLATTLKYRYYDYGNRSERILFPGYAAFGESFWRTVKNDKGPPVFNEPPSYTRHTGELSAGLEVFRPLSVTAEGFWDRWDYRGVRVDSTDEVGAGGGFDWRLGHAAKLHGSYRFARRTPTRYELGNQATNPEAVGLTNYNWGDRKRHKASLRAEASPSDMLSFGVGGQYQDDDLGAGDRFGLKSQKSAIGSLDASYEPSELVSLSVDYSREHRKGRMQNGAKDDAFNAPGSLDDAFTGDNFNPYNYWNTDITENVDTLGLETTVRPTDKVELNAGYAFSYSRMDFATANPNSTDSAAAGFGSGAKLANGVAQAWPTVVGRLHEVRASAAYRLLKDLRVGLNYLFEDYSLDDFANAAAYLAGASAENSTRYVFTRANQFDYTAHVIGTYVAWRF